MDLKLARKILIAASRRAGVSFDEEEQDFALQAMFRDLELTDVYSLQDTPSVSLTANNPNVDLSVLNSTNPDLFRPDKISRCEFTYTDNGAWSDSSVSYVKGIDLVSYSDKFWVCTVSNTSTASTFPGSGDNQWKQTLSKRGKKIGLVDYDNVANLLGDGLGLPLQNYFVLATNNPTVSPSQPTIIGFQTQDNAFVYPVPDVAYKILFTIKSEIAAWEAGTEANIDFTAPEKLIIPAIQSGGVYYLDKDRRNATLLLQQFQVLKDKIASALYVDRGVAFKHEKAYQDNSGAFRYSNGGRWGY